MTSHDAFENLKESLFLIYEQREAENIADWVMENISEKKRWERKSDTEPLTQEQEYLFFKYQEELLNHRPVQYVLHEAWFYGLKFFVDESVLIPRPETENLVELMLQENKKPLSILDIGTGSGCIPVLLKKKNHDYKVTAIDVSEKALEVAKKNAELNQAEVGFNQINILDSKQWDMLTDFDIIVSNPPYVTPQEKDSLAPNVLNFEPSLALFVPENDPLLFYKVILLFSQKKLKPGGKIYLEVNTAYAKEVADLFTGNEWKAEILKDYYGKERMVKVVR